LDDSLRWQFKVCLIGDGYVGKTSIRRKYLGKVFKTNYIPTLGVDFAQKTLDYDGGSVLLVIWDIAGQPLFQGLRRRYYDGCSGMILTYSVDDRESFDHASRWLVEAHGFLGYLPPLIIAANKIDLRPGLAPEESVSYEEGQAFARMFGEKMNTPSVFIETSALTGENIEEAFQALVKIMIKGEEEESGAQVQAEVSEPTSTDGTVMHAEPAEEATEPPVPGLEFVQEAQIGLSMTELVDLKGQLRDAEIELANMTAGREKRLLTLKNTIHVKRITYEHLKKQLLETRQDWADAYDEYVKLDKQKNTEAVEKMRRIEELRKRVERMEGVIGKQIRDLNLEVKQ
jgi:small GTP-binding protein